MKNFKYFLFFIYIINFVYANQNFYLPLGKYTVNKSGECNAWPGFGVKGYFDYHKRNHTGIDIQRGTDVCESKFDLRNIAYKSGENVDVYSMCDGKISFIYSDKHYTVMRIIHNCNGEEIIAYYGHLDPKSIKNLKLKKGDSVVAGQKIAKLYKYSNAHLHLTITDKNSPNYILNREYILTYKNGRPNDKTVYNGGKFDKNQIYCKVGWGRAYCVKPELKKDGTPKKDKEDRIKGIPMYLKSESLKRLFGLRNPKEFIEGHYAGDNYIKNVCYDKISILDIKGNYKQISISKLLKGYIQAALPILSRNTSTPSVTKYDVYGIADQTLYGYLKLIGDFTRSSIIVRDFFNRSEVGMKRGGLDDNHRFLGGTNDNSWVDGIFGQNIYSEGDYLFAAYVQENSSTHKFGYPVKFSIVSKGSFVIDNDQLNTGHNPVNDEDSSTTFNSIHPDYIKIGEFNMVPGYFLTAYIYQGNSNAWAQWKPNKKGKYKIFIYIPEHGPSAERVRYKIKINNENIILSDYVNQKDNKGKWIQLTANNSALKEFKLEESGYVGIILDQKTNKLVKSTEYVAFDAIKFIKVDEVDIESTLDGAGSIVRPDESCESIYGYGCYRDIAIMHSHIDIGKSSTVVFQWKRNESTCKNLKIYSEYAIDAVLKQKPWYSLSFDKRYDISLNGGRENYVIISPSSIWTTLFITSKSPIYYPIKIFAECTNESAEYSSYQKIEKSPDEFNILFDGAKWTGTGSLISAADQIGYGKEIDLVKIDNKKDSIATFQWFASQECSRLLVEGVYYTNTYYRDNSIPVENIKIKEWDDSNDKFIDVCYSLPCQIDNPFNGNRGYAIVKIHTKPYNRKANSNLIMAQCIQ